MKKGNIIRKAVLLSLLIICCRPGLAQNPPDNPYVSKKDPGLVPDYSINKADLLSDVDMFVDKVDEVHPDPYRLISKENFVAEAEKIKTQIKASDNENINLFDCYYYLQKLAALIHDGHTKIYTPANWSEVVSSFFPLNIKIVEGRVFVNENFGDNEIPLKAEILSINDKNVEDLISDMLNYCEGTLLEYKLSRVEEEFRYFIHTLYKFEAPWKVDYVFDGTNKTTSIEGISRELLTEKNKKNLWFSESSIRVSNDEVPMFNLPHLGYRKEDFKPVIDKFFDDHIDKKNIVINLRGCPGGNGLRTYEVVDHLIDTEYSGSKRFSFRVSQTLKDYVKYYIQDYLYEQNRPIDQWKDLLYTTGIWNDEYDEIYKNVLDSDLNTFTQEVNEYHTPDKQVSKYKGDVFLLVDQRSFSAAVVFASIFKHYELATIVGRETGGRVDFFSDAVDIELPKSKLISKIPTALLTLHGEIPHRGIIPDKVVDLTVDGFLSGNDPDIEAIKSMIR
jgi:hypothetical protein